MAKRSRDEAEELNLAEVSPWLPRRLHANKVHTQGTGASSSPPEEGIGERRLYALHATTAGQQAMSQEETQQLALEGDEFFESDVGSLEDVLARGFDGAANEDEDGDGDGDGDYDDHVCGSESEDSPEEEETSASYLSSSEFYACESLARAEELRPEEVTYFL
jgi:hypothetical protein